MAFDLGIEGGTVVTPAGAHGCTSTRAGGRIAALTSDRQPAERTVDASGLLVMPGMVDTHVTSWTRPPPSARTSRPGRRPPRAQA
jgi:dihydropyrimidinase